MFGFVERFFPTCPLVRFCEYNRQILYSIPVKKKKYIKNIVTVAFFTNNEHFLLWRNQSNIYTHAVVVLALPVPWVRFLLLPLTAIQTHTKKCKGYNKITIY